MNVYNIIRFSYHLIEGVKQGKEYINTQFDTGISTVHDNSTKVTEDPRLKDVKPVKRYGRLVRDLSYLLKRKKKRSNNNQ